MNFVGLEFYKEAPHQFIGTQVVGKKKSNAWGLYDMIGNVQEWNEDWYGDKNYDKPQLADLKGGNSGNFRVLRGGSWNYYARDGRLRLSYRNGSNPSTRFSHNGFRIVFLP